MFTEINRMFLLTDKRMFSFSSFLLMIVLGGRGGGLALSYLYFCYSVSHVTKRRLDINLEGVRVCHWNGNELFT